MQNIVQKHKLIGALSSAIKQISLQFSESHEFVGSHRGQSLITAETKHLLTAFHMYNITVYKDNTKGMCRAVIHLLLC